MIIGKGKGVFGAIAIGEIFVFQKETLQVGYTFIDDIQAEKEKLTKSVIVAKEQLQKLYDKTLIEIGLDEAMIIDVQMLMVEDMDFLESIEKKITEQKKNLVWAISETGNEFAVEFASMDNVYMNARATDVKDIAGRLARIASGVSEESIIMDKAMIVVAEDLAPSETVQFDKDKLLGFVTRKGSSNSHTAILARTMSLPAIVSTNIQISPSLNGKLMIVNGHTGDFYIDPDEQLLEKMKKQQKEELDQQRMLEELIGKENVTLDGRKVHIYSNIGKVEDVDYVIDNDSCGIGLFRSEFLYLGRTNYPTEEEQFNSYKTVAERMEGKKVIIRTLDIGADKQADYFNMEEEENPAMGYRAIRICLDRIDIFKTQLRAIYRASAFGTVSIMFPMIISVSEIVKIKEIVEIVKGELTAEGYKFGAVELGIMIETPAAVMISDELAKEVEFFSVGTNDLTQYTLAIDRQNEKLDNIFDSHHPAVMRMLQMIVDNAHKNGIWAGICGELASDLTLTETFLKMGYDELSVSPTFTLPLRKKIRECNLV